MYSHRRHGDTQQDVLLIVAQQRCAPLCTDRARTAGEYPQWRQPFYVLLILQLASRRPSSRLTRGGGEAAADGQDEAAWKGAIFVIVVFVVIVIRVVRGGVREGTR